MSTLLRTFTVPIFTGLDNNGVPVPGGQLYTYAAGTTSPLATYTDAQGQNPQTNPVILDANGRAVLYLANNVYKFVLEDENGVTLWTVDQVSGVNTVNASDLQGTLTVNQLPTIPLSKITVDVDPGTKFYYQHVLAAGISQAQRTNLNFLAPFVVDDNATIPATEIGLGPSGVAPGQYTSPTLTVDTTGRITAAANGAAATYPHQYGANGYVQLADLFIQWATGTAQSTGNNVQQTINFPMAFPNSCFFVLAGTYTQSPSDGKPQTYTAVSWNQASCVVAQLRGDNQGTITNAPIIIAVGN